MSCCGSDERKTDTDEIDYGKLIVFIQFIFMHKNYILIVQFKSERFTI